MTTDKIEPAAALAKLHATAAATPSRTREGLNITLGTSLPARHVAASDTWTVAGWNIQFVRLGANATLTLDQSAGDVYVKVVSGQLASLQRGAFGAPRQVRSTLVESDQIAAGDDGALIAVMTATPGVPDNIHAMDQLAFAGPHPEIFQWVAFEQKFGKFTDAFNGLDAYMVPGFHLLDDDGVEITYVQFWTAGKGVDLSTHNHGNQPSPTAPAFAEVHWVFNNGTGKGGMYTCDAPGAPTRQRYPMLRGEEHGAFFISDPDTGSPMLRDNGAVEYPWHGWQAGTDEGDGQAFDFVAAFETNPDYVKA